MINLGDEVKDMVSGFQGVAVARHTYLQGCARISIQPPIDKDGRLPDSYAFDEPMCEVIKAGKVAPVEAKKPGGPDKYRDVRRY